MGLLSRSAQPAFLHNPGPSVGRDIIRSELDRHSSITNQENTTTDLCTEQRGSLLPGDPSL